MNKSAIEKMVEWLEEKVNPNNNEILSNADHLVVETYHEAFKKAISLLAEEQAQKPTGQDTHGFGVISVEKRDKILKDLYRPFPSNDKSTAPAGLVEDIETWGNKAVLEGNASNIDWASFDEILSRYRPSTQADIVGELKEVIRVERIYLKDQTGDVAHGFKLALFKIEEIIAKAEKGGEE